MVFVMIWIVLLNWFSGTFAQTETTFNIQNFLKDFKDTKTKMAEMDVDLKKTKKEVQRTKCEKWLTEFEVSVTNIYECIIQVDPLTGNNEPAASDSKTWKPITPVFMKPITKVQKTRKPGRAQPTRPPVTTLFKQKGSKHPATAMLFNPDVEDPDCTYMKLWFENARHHVCHKSKCMKSDPNFFTDEMNRIINSTIIAQECKDEKIIKYVKSEDLDKIIKKFEIFKTKYASTWAFFAKEENRKLAPKEVDNFTPTVEK